MKVEQGPWKGLRVELKDTGSACLPEYPSEDSVPGAGDDHHSSTYVEVTNGQQFKISFARPPGFHYAFAARITIDGRRVYNFIQEAGVSTVNIAHYDEKADGGFFRKSLVFGSLEVAEDGPRLDPSKVNIDDLGKIRINLEAGTAIRTGTSSVDCVDSSNLGGKAKKLLDLFVIGEKIGQAQARDHCSFDRSYSIPALTLEFIYRTGPVLQTLEVKPRNVKADAGDKKPSVEGSGEPKVEGSRKRKTEGDDSSTKKTRKISPIDLTNSDASRTASVELVDDDEPDEPDEPDEVIDLTV